MKSAADKAMIEVEDKRETLDSRERILKQDREELDEEREAFLQAKADVRKNIDDRVKLMWNSEKNFLRVGFCMSTAYSLLITVMMALSQETCRTDLVESGKWILGQITRLWSIIGFVTEWLFNITGAEGAFRWVIRILVPVLIFGCLITVLVLLVKKIWRPFKQRFFNARTVMVILVSLAVLVFTGDRIQSVLPLNLVLIFVIVQVIYIAASLIVDYCRK